MPPLIALSDGITVQQDHFPCALLISNTERQIRYANSYLTNQFGFNPVQLLQMRIHDLFSPAAKIMLESYVIPLLLHEGQCKEILLTLQTPAGDKMPVLLNARLQQTAQSDTEIFWSLSSAGQRDKLYQELLIARQQLEHKASMLQTLSQTDELTGLLNRRAFIERAEQALQLQQHTGQDLALLMLDIDHFKTINDQFGHDAGDQVLRQLGQMLRQSGRQTDSIARFGGEEFILLLPDTDRQAAICLAERLRTQVQSIRIGEHRLTISIGISTLNVGQTASFAWLFKQADLALYQAKHAGRDQVVTQPVDPAPTADDKI